LTDALQLKKYHLNGNADQLRNFAVNFLILRAIRGEVLPFLNRIFGAHFVPCETMFLIRQMRSEASQGKHLAAQYASPRNLFTFCI